MKKLFTFRQFVQVADKVCWMLAVLLCLTTYRQLLGIGIAVMGGAIYGCLLLEKILIEIRATKSEMRSIKNKLNGLPKEYKRNK